MVRKMLIAGLSVLALAATAVAGGDSMWFHVYVHERGDDGEKVRINLPLQLVEAVLPLIDEADISHGRVRIDDSDLTADDLRQIWDAVRDAEDGVYVEVEGVDEEVRVAREGDMIVVRVEEEGEEERVEVKLPVAVIDALLSGEGDELDILAAIRAFGERGEGDLVMVTDDESTVRIWVDRDSSGGGEES